MNSRIVDLINHLLLHYLIIFVLKEREEDFVTDLEDWYENQIVDKGFNYAKNIFS